MEQSPYWKANTHSGSREIEGLLQNPKVHYHVHKSLAMVPIQSEMNPVISPILFLYDLFWYHSPTYA
jgi:hypothetical protein